MFFFLNGRFLIYRLSVEGCICGASAAGMFILSPFSERKKEEGERESKHRNFFTANLLLLLSPCLLSPSYSTGWGKGGKARPYPERKR